MNRNEEIENLKKKIAFIEKKQVEFGSYIDKLKQEISSLKGKEYSNTLESLIEETENEPVIQNTSSTVENKFVKPKPVIYKKSFVDELIDKYELKSNLENFIGTNLISKIGILILTIGVIIGAKLAIDNDLISPLTRIIIGYGISAAVLAFAIKLKVKYLNFSAVLLAGALCMLYFLSFIAYDFYQFIPASISFGLMLLFTVFAVMAALNYNKQIIALLGLVGSYSIPFLLSNDSGNVLFLFSYLALINLALLYISFIRNWKPIFYTAFLFTWLIFSVWLFDSYSKIHFVLGLCFAILFYLIFYATFIAHKLIKKQVFEKIDIIFILINSFVFYVSGFFLLEQNTTASEYLGLFTLLNAIIHFIVAKLFFTKENTDVNLFYLAIGLVFIFITIAIPVQLEGNWIIIFWLLEATLLFCLGRIRNIAFYEKLSYPLIIISAISLFTSIASSNYAYKNVSPFLNLVFLTAIIGTTAYGTINYFHFKKSSLNKNEKLFKILNIVLPTLFIITLFVTFSNEISQIFNIKSLESKLEIATEDSSYHIRNYLIDKYKDFSVFVFAGFLVLLFSLLNLKFLKIKTSNSIISVAKLVMLFLSLTLGLFICSEIRYTYLSGSEYYDYSILALYIRYAVVAISASLVYLIHYYLKENLFPFPNLKKYFNILLHLVILWLLSSELLHWLDIFGNKNAYKLILSILWGSYSLLMVVIGLWKNQKYTRIAAIALFAATLIKLFFYDISNLSMIYRTIVFIVLGALLLVISFLYNKFSKSNTETNA
ncbi:MAG: DUF2339 domain-containing protein [Chitinophagales bacterium]